MNHLRVLAVIAVLASTSSAFPEETSGRVGRLTVAIDESSSYPGGLITVRLRSAPRYGVVNAILDGRRCPFLSSHRGMRALVPVPVDATPGPTTLGIEVRAGNGRQRFALPITVAERSYPARSVLLPEVKKAMLTLPTGVRDGRLVQLYLRTVSKKQEWSGPFHAPVPAPAEPSFGCPQTYDAPPPVEAKTDAIWGEYHRGLDYIVPVGTPVSSPAAGTVLFAGPLLLTGETVVLDHGQGVVSVFYHLASTPVRDGDWVEAGAPLGLTGETGIAAVPHLHWGVYVHGVAVDPHVTQQFAD
jgi:murein DD-endopeptidase MepM/ murein hydrolase activator NlpD